MLTFRNVTSPKPFYTCIYCVRTADGDKSSHDAFDIRNDVSYKKNM